MENLYFTKELVEQSVGEQVSTDYYLALDHIAKDLLLREGQKNTIGRVSGYPDPIGKGEQIFRDLYYRLNCEENPRNEMFNIAFELKEDPIGDVYILSCYTADNTKILWSTMLDKHTIDKEFQKF